MRGRVTSFSVGAVGLVALLVAAPAGAAPALPAQLEGVRDFVEARLHERPSAGLSLSVRHGNEHWAQGFGYANRAQKTPAQAETVYRFASVTKMFTAAAVMQQWEQKKLRLRDTIQTHLPWYPQKRYPITIKHLLGHLSGISHYRNKSGPEGHIQATLNTRQSLAVFMDWPLVSRPGSRFVYTSYGFNVLGAIVEKVSATRYGPYLQEHIFGPAGMTDSMLDNPAVPQKNRATGYKIRKGKLTLSDKVNIMSRFAGGGTRGTVVDMTRFGQALAGGKLVKPSTFRRMQRSMVNGKGRLTDYGMGMAVYHVGGRPVIAHAGAQPETTTLLLIYPADDLVIGLATNVEDQTTLLYEIAAKVAESVLQDGARRRDLTGANLGDSLLADALTQIMGQGLSAHRRGHNYGQGDARLLVRAFSDVRDLLQSPPTLDETSLYQGLDRYWGPAGEYAFTRVGAHMAGVIEAARGKDALTRYHVLGALPFFADYTRLCRLAWCPNAFRLDEATEQKLLAAADTWDQVFDHTLQRTTYPHGKTVEQIEAELSPRFAGQAFRPNFAPDLLDRAERAIRAGDAPTALAWSSLAHRLFPFEAKVLIALGQAEAMTEAQDGTRFVQAAALPGGKKRLSPGRMKYRALVLRKAGAPTASLTVLRAAALLHPDDDDIHDAHSRDAARLGLRDEAWGALVRAIELAPTPRRKARLEALGKDMKAAPTAP